MCNYFKTVSMPAKIYEIIKNTAKIKRCSLSKVVTKAVLEMLKKNHNTELTQPASDKLIIEIKFDKD